MRYRYIARASDGARVSGQLDASGKPQAIERLSQQRLTPVEIREIEDTSRPSLTYKDVGQLCGELARLIKAGVPLESGVRLAADAQDRKPARLALETAAARLADGDGPGRSFAGLRGAPGRALSAIIAAGERSGRLAEALEAAGPLFKAAARFREKILSLLLYPAVVSVTALVVLLVFLMVVIPNLRPVLDGLGDNVPPSARTLLAIADTAPTVMTIVLIGALGGILLGQIPAMRRRFGVWRDRWMLTPLGMGIAEAVDVALFARLFAALLRAGTPAGDAVAEASQAVSNQILRERFDHAARRVREGGSLDAALSGALGERHLIVQASRLGSRGGGFADLVAEAGASLAERAETRMERLATLAGPAIILILGGVIGVMVLTLFSALSALPDAALT